MTVNNPSASYKWQDKGGASIIAAAAGTTGAWTDIDLSSVVGSAQVLAILRVMGATATRHWSFRPNGDSSDYNMSSDNKWGANSMYTTGKYGIIIVPTDSSGIIEYYLSDASNITVDVLGYVE